MASKTTLNAKNLQALGSKRLAELLLELTKGNTAAKQKLRLELAATLLRRALIDFSLGEGRSTRYRHAARHLMEYESMAGRIADFGDAEPHDSYVTRLRARHGKKTSFWALVN